MQTRNARIETLGGAIVRFPFGVTVRRALVAVCGFAALAGCATLVGCSSDEEEEPAVVEEPQDPEETQVSTEPGIPITITAEYAPGTNLAAKKPIPLESVTEEGYAQKNRIAFTDNGTDVSAVWEAGDQIYVVCNGKISLLSLQSGAGTNKGTFVGDLAGYSGDNKPAADSELICYVRNTKYKNAITVQTDGTFKDNRNFTKQTGALYNAGAYTVYRGTTEYGTGSNIMVNFKIHDTCLMRFGIAHTNGVSVGSNVVVSYFQGDTELARATYKASPSDSVYIRKYAYMLVPAGTYSGAAILTFTNQTLITPRPVKLGTNTYSVTLEVGKFYAKSNLEPSYLLGDYFYENGWWGELEEHPEGYKAVAKVFSLSPQNEDLLAGYTHGYACALETLGPTQWGTKAEKLLSTYNITNQSGRSFTDSVRTRTDGACIAAVLAYNYKNTYDLSSTANGNKSSGWFLPTAVLASAAENACGSDKEVHTSSELDATQTRTSKSSGVKKASKYPIRPVFAF